MKKSILFCLMLGLINLSYSQAPQGIPYQAVARDAQGNPMANQVLTVQFSLHEASVDGSVVFQETQSTTTNGQGLFSLTFGAGVPSVGTFTNINWGSGYKFLQVQADFGNGYVDLGTQQLMSVPYALYAGSSNSSNNHSLYPGAIGKGVTSISVATNTGNLRENINFCYSLEEDGYTDWRLPTSEEMFDYYSRNGINVSNENCVTITNPSSIKEGVSSSGYFPIIVFNGGFPTYNTTANLITTFCVR